MNRIQRKRTKGWKMPSGTIYVGRPSMWSNPFRDNGTDIVYVYAGHRRKILDPWIYFGLVAEVGTAAEVFGKMLMNLHAFEVEKPIYEHMRKIRDRIKDLGEYDNVACWCSLDKECHADHLINLAKTYR